MSSVFRAGEVENNGEEIIMADNEKIYHNLKSKTIGLKSAVELLEKCPPEKKDKVIRLMREAAQDIIMLLTELEAKPKS